MLAFALTLHLLQPPLQLPVHPHRPRLLLADNAPIAPPPAELTPVVSPGTLEPPGDPNQGSVTAGEFGAAALGALLANGVSIGVGIVVGLALAPSDGDQDIPPSVAWGVLIGTLVDLIAVPVLAGLSASWAAPDDASGSWGSAALRAGLVHLVALGLFYGLTVGTNSIAGLVAFAAMDLIAVPLAASWGMHSGDAHPQASPAAAARSEMPALAAMRPVQQAMGLRFRF